jgi:hypothetical protein
MENGDKTAERLERAAVMEVDHTYVADGIDWRVSQINCDCQWQFGNNYRRILHCRQDTVESQIAHPVKSYLLYMVEIPSLTWSVNNDGG